MTTLRSYLNPDPLAAPAGPTVFKTERNQHAVRCASCDRVTYVDQDLFNFRNRAVSDGFDDPFRCEWCTRQFEKGS